MPSYITSVPCEQAVHCVMPVLPLTCPGLQDAHDVVASLSLSYRPTVRGMHDVAPEVCVGDHIPDRIVLPECTIVSVDDVVVVRLWLRLWPVTTLPVVNKFLRAENCDISIDCPV